MSRNDALDFAQRLYSRIPAHYRVYDAEQGLPLYALLTVVGEQAANIRTDIDALWDNFFIETCADWVVPYLGALAGTNLLTGTWGRAAASMSGTPCSGGGARARRKCFSLWRNRSAVGRQAWWSSSRSWAGRRT